MMNQIPPAPKRPRSNSPNGHQEESMGFQNLPNLPPMQEEAHSLMNSYEMKAKIEFDEFSMNSFNPLVDEFGTYPGDPYMYSSHPFQDMNQPISSITDQPPMGHLGHFPTQFPINPSEKMSMGVQLNPQQTHQMGMGVNMGYPNSHFPNYISMSGVPMSNLGAPPNGSSMGLPLQSGQIQGSGIPPMSQVLNKPINNPTLIHPSSTDQASDIKPQLGSAKQRDAIHNPGTPVVCSPDSSSNVTSQKALCTSSTTSLMPHTQPNHSAIDSQLCQTHSGQSNLQNQLSYPNQQLKPIQEGSEISSLQSVTHHGMIETDENRHRLLQQQLGILLHAHRCLKLGTGGDCKVPMCSTMKDVLKHMTVSFQFSRIIHAVSSSYVLNFVFLK